MRRFNIQIDYNDIDKYYDDLVRLPIYFVDNKTTNKSKLDLGYVIPVWLIKRIKNEYIKKGYKFNLCLIDIIVRHINSWFNRSNLKICYIHYGISISAFSYSSIELLNAYIKHQKIYFPDLTIENFDCKNRLQLAYDFI